MDVETPHSTESTWQCAFNQPPVYAQQQQTHHWEERFDYHTGPSWPTPSCVMNRPYTVVEHDPVTMASDDGGMMIVEGCQNDDVSSSPVTETGPPVFTFTDTTSNYTLWLRLHGMFIKQISQETGLVVAAPSECRVTNESTDRGCEYRLEWYRQKEARNHVYLDIIEQDFVDGRLRVSYEITRNTRGAISNKKFTTNAFLFYLNMQLQAMFNAG
jgi:hypothetical protein